MHKQDDRLRRSRLGVLLLALLGASAWADYGAERQMFTDAERALQQGDQATFLKLRAQLGDYPLLPYLDYQRLTRRIDETRGDAVKAFLARHGDTPLAPLLRTKWLRELARRKQWQQFLVLYDDDAAIETRCHYLQALIATGAKEKAFTLVEPVWLHGESRPKACDPVFDAWRRAGRQHTELTWRRIAMAMRAGEHRLATYLGRYLPDTERGWASTWVQLHHRPQQARDHARFAADHPYRSAMLSHAVKRLTRRDPLEALAMWRELDARYRFAQHIRHVAERDLAIALSRRSEPEARQFVAGVQPCSHDRRLLVARLRSALAAGEWLVLMDRLDRLPPDMANSERWRYWRARALAETGRADEARGIYASLAGERSFFGFLAADRIGADYHLTHADTPIDKARLERIAAEPAAVRAQELRQLSRLRDARREWRHLTRHLDRADLQAAAKLAEHWGWHDQAIFTLARTGYWDDLELRFPLTHSPTVANNATTNGLDDAWVFAVIRQESAFMENARSPAGARGLMQLMPRTARVVARKHLKRNAPKRSELFEPELNIALGTAYLRQVLDRLGQHQVLALAAYNAGPHRVEKWLPEFTQDADVWIELVPFRETRGYLQRVLTYTAIYEQRLGREPTRLRDRMPPVKRIQELAADERPDQDTQG